MRKFTWKKNDSPRSILRSMILIMIFNYYTWLKEGPTLVGSRRQVLACRYLTMTIPRVNLESNITTSVDILRSDGWADASLDTYNSILKYYSLICSSSDGCDLFPRWLDYSTQWHGCSDVFWTVDLISTLVFFFTFDHVLHHFSIFQCSLYIKLNWSFFYLILMIYISSFSLIPCISRYNLLWICWWFFHSTCIMPSMKHLIIELGFLNKLPLI